MNGKDVSHFKKIVFFLTAGLKYMLHFKYMLLIIRVYTVDPPVTCCRKHTGVGNFTSACRPTTALLRGFIIFTTIQPLLRTFPSEVTALRRPC